MERFLNIWFGKFSIKTAIFAGCQWLMPVILATWEVEIGKSIVQGQLG
jgi:hypothetical protein